ncbi:MAG: hypothetical protein QOD24_5007, partial [Solirubrobacteraceae bacterium]|nr:hypothetical protein [Solirubrobacteraceae bacterium]
MTLGRALELRARCDYRGALAALADAEDALSLIERSRLHEDVGDYEAARLDAERAVAIAQGTPVLGSALARIAGVARAQRRPREAERVLRDVPGDEPLVERAAALEELARLDEAENLLRSAVSDDPRVLLAMRMGFGGVARSRGHYDEAERELRAAIAHAETSFGSCSLETAAALNALGMVFKYSGRFDEGVELYERALSILQRAVGEEHPDVASIYHNL